MRPDPKPEPSGSQRIFAQSWSAGDVGTLAGRLTEGVGQAACGQGAGNINETCSDQCCNVLHTCEHVEYVCGLTTKSHCIRWLWMFVFRQQCSAHWLGLFLLLQAKQKQFITQLIVQGLLMLLEVPVTMILLPGISQSANLRDLWAGKTTRFGLHHLASLVRTP